MQNNHAEFHLFGCGVRSNVLLVIGSYLDGGNDDVVADLGLAHRLHGDLVLLRLTEPRHGESLRLKRADKSHAISSKVLADDALDAVIDHIIGDAGAFLLLFSEFLQDQCAVDKILDRLLPYLLHLFFKLLSLIDLGNRFLLGGGNFPNLGKSDHLSIHDGGNAIDHLLGGVQGN